MNEALPATELRDESTAGLDLRSTAELVTILAAAQRTAVDAVASEEGALAALIDAIVERISRGGRLHYVGAGTSGRLAVLDAAEMPPTFGTPPELVCAHIAGDQPALLRAVEGAEDDVNAGIAEMKTHVRPGDAVVGISASGGAPFVVGAIRTARESGAVTGAIVNAKDSPLAAAAEIAVVLPTGPEPIAGSTRMKAGTAQKIALNTLSTAVMVKLGKVYDNLMVDVVATNEKLRKRAVRLVSTLTGADEERARTLLAKANGSVKVAVVIAKRNVDNETARKLLDENRGRLRELL